MEPFRPCVPPSENEIIGNKNKKQSIRQPKISANTEREQLIQMRSNLYQLAQQLQWAFGSISGGGEIQTVVRNPSSAVSNSNDHVDGPKTFAALKNLIIKSADIVEAYYDEINNIQQGGTLLWISNG